MSVIVLAFNGEEYLGACLEALLDQDYPSSCYEVLVVDNGSHDKSNEIVAGFDRVRLLELGRNLGFASGNNIGLRATNGELVAFVNQDTVVVASWLSALVSGIIDRGYDACHSNQLLPRNAEYSGISGRETPTNVYHYRLTAFGYVEQLCEPWQEEPFPTNFLSGASFLIRRDVVDRFGYVFDELFESYCEDNELSLRLASHGFKMAVVPRSVIYHSSSFSYALSTRNVWKNSIMCRNRFLAYWRGTPPRQFLYRLPFLLLSHPRKAYRRGRVVGLGVVPAVAAGLAGLGFTAVGATWFMGTVATRRVRPYGR